MKNSPPTYYSKQKLYDIIFKSDTKEGKAFDIYLLIIILFSVVIVILDSISILHEHLRYLFLSLEYTITLLFSIEYLLRIYCHKKPEKYIFSFFGIIDFITLFFSYLSLLFVGTQALTIVRIFRLIRIFRILNMKEFISEASYLLFSLKKSFHKIVIFMLFVLITAVILGTLMFFIEGNKNPAMNSIPRGIYWAIVTLTTVGYGDITPVTNIGMFISGVIMILGYSVIAVPTGILSADMVKYSNKKNQRKCPNCMNVNENTAIYCKYCGSLMRKMEEDKE